MKILFDVGNTHTVIGYKDKNTFKTFRIGTNNIQTEDELYSIIINLLKYENINLSSIDSFGVASVVPEKNYTIEKLGKKYFKCDSIFLEAKKNVFNINWSVEYPKEIGADRVANVIGSKLEIGDNVIVIDFGTAITIDIINKGNFIGGAILPGLRTSMLGLFKKTAKLPQVELKITNSVIGKNTVENIQIGVIKTTILGIEQLIKEINNETKTEHEIISTGGMARSLKDYSPIFKNYDPYLTLRGIDHYTNLQKILI
jgi:type III pantothenate kinase